MDLTYGLKNGSMDVDGFFCSRFNWWMLVFSFKKICATWVFPFRELPVLTFYPHCMPGWNVKKVLLRSEYYAASTAGGFYVCIWNSFIKCFTEICLRVKHSLGLLWSFWRINRSESVFFQFLSKQYVDVLETICWWKKWQFVFSLRKKRRIWVETDEWKNKKTPTSADKRDYAELVR